jgi:hypothetical protein
MSSNPVPEWWFLGSPVSASERPSSQGDEEMTQTAQTETDPREVVWASFPNDALLVGTNHWRTCLDRERFKKR